jgi:two-component system response regulator MprA
MNPSTVFQSPRVPSKKRILVVDDDEAVRTGLRCVLIMEGYQVVSASNGLEGIVAFRREPCDLALIDMNMPIQNGWGTIAGLRGFAPTLPIVIITARPDQGNVAREAAVELMEKPLNLPTLLARMRELLDPATTSAT